MNKLDYILVCLMEECAEVQQDCAKALRFGLYDCKPNTEKTNITRLTEELTDVKACILMLEKELGFTLETEVGVQAKIDKVRRYSNLSCSLGKLEEEIT